MSYKDQTFCDDWCANTKCFRNYQHIVEGKEKGEINQNTVISFFVGIPMDCTEMVSKVDF